MLTKWYYSIPAVTRLLFTSMSLLFVLSVFATGPRNFCLAPVGFGSDNFMHSLFTLVSSTYMHLSFFHIFWNMSVLVYYGGVYERKWGSIKFFINVTIAGLLCNLIHLLIAGFLSLLPIVPGFLYDSLVNTCSLGFSGVLFFLISVDCFDPDVPPTEGQQIFGLMPVPKRYYPWIMLALMQLMVKNISFLGHLSGLLLGLLYARDRQHIFHFKRQWIEYLESTTICERYLQPRAMWVPKNQLPGSDLPPSIAFTEALQQQLHAFYSGRPQSGETLGESALPAQPPPQSFAASSSSHASTAPPAAAAPKFPGEGHTLGR